MEITINVWTMVLTSFALFIIPTVAYLIAMNHIRKQEGEITRLKAQLNAFGMAMNSLNDNIAVVVTPTSDASIPLISSDPPSYYDTNDATRVEYGTL